MQRRKKLRRNFGAIPVTYPQPVFIIATYDENGTPNAMNAAWGGISEEKEIMICVDSNHKTAKNVVKSKAFTVSMATAPYLAQCDYVGIVSGNDEPDKFIKAGFHAIQSEFVNAPLINELPVAVECKLIGYDVETCRLIGEIINVCADECVLNEEGKVDPKKLQPITFDPMNHTYMLSSEVVGRAFNDGKKLLRNV